MTRFAKIGFLLIAAACLIGIGLRVQRVLARDPFRGLKEADILGTVGIRLQEVKARHYSKDKLIGLADVKRIDVRQDRQYLDFFGISHGLLSTDQGNISFDADAANFNAINHQFLVTSAAKVSNKDMALATPQFRYDDQTGLLDIPGKVEGRFFDGNVAATGLTYKSKDKSYEISNARWIGKLPQGSIQGATGQGDSQRTPWDISGHVKGNPDMDVYTNATATDGEVLVKAPRLERDKHTDVLTLTGKVYYFSEKANLICDKAVIYRKEKRAVLTGDVHMLVKPKDQEKLELGDIPPYRPPVPSAVAENRPAAPPPQEAQQQKDLDDELRSSKTGRKYPAHVKADRIEYWYGKGSRHAVITGSPQAYQELAGTRWRRVVTHRALYDGEKDELTLESEKDKKDTRIVDSLGDDLQADSFTVSTKEDDDTYEGEGVVGRVYPDDEDLQKSKGNPKPQPAPPAQQPGTPPQPPPAKGKGRP